MIIEENVNYKLSTLSIDLIPTVSEEEVRASMKLAEDAISRMEAEAWERGEKLTEAYKESIRINANPNSMCHICYDGPIWEPISLKIEGRDLITNIIVPDFNKEQYESEVDKKMREMIESGEWIECIHNPEGISESEFKY